MSETDYRLLIISDSAEAEAEGVILLLSKALPAAITTLKSASDLTQAVVTLNESNPDVVLVFGQSETWLNEVVEGLVKLQVKVAIPIIAMTDDQSLSLLGCLERGAADYFYCRGAEIQLLDTVIRRQIPESNRSDLDYLDRLERDQQSGLRVQQTMLPESPASFGGLRFQHKLYPTMIMSGDFVDYFQLADGRVAFYIADVSGHGAPAAFVTVLLKGLSRRVIEQSTQLKDTGEILAWFNNELMPWQLEQHVTMFFGVIDSEASELEYSNAAHFPGTILCDGTDAKFLNIGGQALGLAPQAEYPSFKVSLPQSYCIAMFSDGVFEIMGETSLVDKEARLLSVVKSSRQATVPESNIEELSDKLALNLHIQPDRRIQDDIAIFTVTQSMTDAVKHQPLKAKG